MVLDSVNVSSFELYSTLAVITLIIYAIKKCATDRLVTKLHQQIKREESIRVQLENKLRALNDLETRSKSLDKKQENVRREINSKKAQLENDEMLLQSLTNKQDQLSHHLQREREATTIKEEEYKKEMIKIDKRMELKKAQFINKMSLYNKEIDAYKEQEVVLNKMINALKEEKIASKRLEELKQITAKKLKFIEEHRILLVDLTTLEEKIKSDVQEKLVSAVHFGSTTKSDIAHCYEAERGTTNSENTM